MGSSVSTDPAAGLIPAGVTGQGDIGYGVYGYSGNVGVVGVGGDAGVFGRGGPGNTGVVGQAGTGTADGVRGFGTGSFSGVAGFGDPAAGTGVYGEGACGVRGIGNGGPNTTPAGAVGVYGQAGPNSNGVEGHGAGTAAGVAGFATDTGGVGVQAVATGVYGMGLFATDFDQSGREVGQAAGWFDGRVVVDGDLLVYGAKHAAVRQRDGSHRMLYSMESLESWFEDFGEGRLVKGKARVRLEPGFASLVKADAFHVFLTPYGDSNGLYVPQRSKQGFEVREQGGGKANVRFSYRIVAKRKDIKGERLAKIALPKVKPRRFVSKPPIKLKAAPALPERLAKIGLTKVKPKKIASKGRRQD